MNRTRLHAALLFTLAGSLSLHGAPRVLADSVQLTTGETLTGEITSQNEQTVTLNHPALGTLVIPVEQVQQVNDSDAPPPDPEPAAEPPVTDFGPSRWILPGFEKSFEAGFNGATGNTDTLNAFLSFTAKRETEEDRWDIVARYFRSTADGETDDNEFNARAQKDWLIPDEKYFFFTRGNYQYDQFKAFEHRVSAYGGVGYPFIEDDNTDLRGGVGLGPTYEFGDVNELTWEAILSLEGVYRLAEGQEITFFNNLIPSLTNGGEFRNTTGVTWSLALDTARGLTLKLGVENEYESDPEPGDERNDLKYFGAIVLNF